jgi:hypothetical protein
MLTSGCSALNALSAIVASPFSQVGSFFGTGGGTGTSGSFGNTGSVGGLNSGS